MRFNANSAFKGLHARLSASKSSWLNYDEEQFERYLLASEAAALGTRMHDHAMNCIKLGIKQRNSLLTFNMYVNDCIGYRMTPEQVLFYSPIVFGTADAISFRKNVLRISDLKTGSGPTSFRQLVVYAALFCLEYDFEPMELDRIELRIYQNNEIKYHEPEAADVKYAMVKIIAFDKRIREYQEEAYL